jgi:Dolichyl-phosphate-mannose-protein mannosyltransferase
MNRSRYAVAFTGLFLAGAALRIMLWLANPSWNAFDDHFEPITMIMNTGTLPRLTGCWQCYHPPFFYLSSAVAGQVMLLSGLPKDFLHKALQSLCCIFGIMNLGVIYLIVRNAPLSNAARAVAFAIACFLPQHIYISAMHSNDTLSYLLTSLCLYLCLSIVRRTPSPWRLVLFSVCATAALFTKYTALVVIPGFVVALAVFWTHSHLPLRRCLSDSKEGSSFENLYPTSHHQASVAAIPPLRAAFRMSGHLQHHLRHVLEGVS